MECGGSHPASCSVSTKKISSFLLQNELSASRTKTTPTRGTACGRVSVGEQDGAAVLSAGQLLWEPLIDRIMLALIEKMHVWLEKESFYALCRITNLKC